MLELLLNGSSSSRGIFVGRQRQLVVVGLGGGGGGGMKNKKQEQQGDGWRRNVASWGITTSAVAVVMLSSVMQSKKVLLEDSMTTLSNIPQTLSSGDSNSKNNNKPLRIQRPKSRQAESCTVKCLGTCIRGGNGSPGEGPLNIRRLTLCMTEFKIPPVIFPSGGTRTTVHHRAPTVPFQPSGFNSYDVTGQLPYSSTFHYGGPSTATTSDALFSDEPSLLEELEIDPTLIYHKTVSILNPIKFNLSIHNPPDLSGPFLYYISFCIIQLLSGKVHFGVVLGWIVVSSILLYFLLNMIEGKYCNLDLYKSFSIIGYSFLPILIFSAVTLFVPPAAAVARMAMAAVFVVWSTWVSARVFTNGNELFGLIAYPCFLIYTLFAMLVLF